jgi:hypothetical protein
MISAIEKLRDLRARTGCGQTNPIARGGLSVDRYDQKQLPSDNVQVSPLPRSPVDLPMDWQIDWEERAAIREYDGGQSREEADKHAFSEILDRYDNT